MSHDSQTATAVAAATSDLTTVQTYLSARVTLRHVNKDAIINKITEFDPDYCLYMHTGDATGKEHFHICFPGRDLKYADVLRKRFKRWFELSGNGGICIKFYDSPLSSFCFYCAHEDGLPVYSNQTWVSVIESLKGTKYDKKRPRHEVDLYMEHESPAKRRTVRDWELTFSNLVPQAVMHRRYAGLGTHSLKEVVRHMMETTKWRPSKALRTQGVHSSYQTDFEFRVGHRDKQDMSWWEPKDRLG